jgi:hypothetical protein
MRIFIFLFVLWTAFFVLQCSKKEPGTGQTVAEIGGQRITVNDFKMRTEMVPRPKYPAYSDEESKHVYLNNLIAEKLMALEGYHKKKNPLVGNTVFKAMIRGIEEQAMREQLYENLTSKGPPASTDLVRKQFALAGREYSVSFFTIYNDSLARRVANELKNEPFITVYQKYAPDKELPVQKVKYTDSDPMVVHDSLYTEPLEPGKLIGPLKIEDNHYLVMRIDDYVINPAVTDTEVQTRWKKVEEKLREKQTTRIRKSTIAGLMKGKTVEFNPATFGRMVSLFYDIFSTEDQNIKNELLRDFLGSKRDEITIPHDSLGPLMLDQPFFSIDRETWTVRDFRDAYMAHPLVLPPVSLSTPTFDDQFRMALISMIRDHYVTREAYKKGLDKDPKVRKTVALWRDAYVAAYQRDVYLKGKVNSPHFKPELMKGRENYLSLYVDSLQAKYSQRIKIYPDVLASVRLTQLDTYFMKPNVPYPAAVPGFPEYVQDGEFDYGTLVKTKEQRPKTKK